MPSSVVGPRSSKALPKAKLAPRKGHSHCLMVCSQPVWSTIAFWILAKPLHLRSMLSKSLRCTKNQMPAVRIDQQNGPSSSPGHPLTTCHTTSASKVEQIGLCSFASSAIFTWPLTNQFSLLQAPRQLFACKMLPQPAGGRKCFPRVCRIPKHRFSCYRNKPTYFALAKMCWSHNGSYFD